MRTFASIISASQPREVKTSGRSMCCQVTNLLSTHTLYCMQILPIVINHHQFFFCLVARQYTVLQDNRGNKKTPNTTPGHYKKGTQSGRYPEVHLINVHVCLVSAYPVMQVSVVSAASCV